MSLINERPDRLSHLGPAQRQHSLRLEPSEAPWRHRRWSLGALIDFEAAFVADEGIDHQILHQRDRMFGLQIQEFRGYPLSQEDESTVLLQWLNHRLCSLESRDSTLGEQIERGYRFLQWAGLVVFGAIVGLPISWSLLSGDSLNIIFLWFAMAGAPFMLTLVACYLLISQSARRRLPQSPPWLRSAMFRLAYKLGGGKRFRLGRLKQRFDHFGGAVGAYFTSLMHLIGVCFAGGLVGGVFLIQIPTEKIYYWGGHSSLVRLTGAGLAKAVHTLALPWKWINGRNAYPSLEQIRMTRLGFAKDRALPNEAYQLPFEAWGQFLLLSCLFYGLLPRLILFVGGRVHLRRSLLHELGAGSEARKVWERVSTAHVTIEEVKGEHGEVAKSPSNPEPPPDADVVRQGSANCDILMIPQGSVAQAIIQRLSKQWRTIRRTLIVPDEADDAREALKGHLPSDGGSCLIYVVQSSRSVPNEAFKELLDVLKHEAGQQGKVSVMLMRHSPTATISSADVGVWRRWLQKRSPGTTLSLEDEASES